MKESAVDWHQHIEFHIPKAVPKVLIFASYYRPAFKAGGPLKSLENLISELSSNISFSIVTRDRDIGDAEAFTTVPLTEWVSSGGCRIMYVAQQEDGLLFRSRLLKETPHDILYLSSFFAKECVYALVARRFGNGGSKPVIVAPRGEFSPGALSLKHLKKTIYMRMGRVAGLFRNVYWHATSALEKEDIQRAFPAILGDEKGSILVAPNLPTAPGGTIASDGVREKCRDEARLIFFGRIARKKNLDYALEIVASVQGKVALDIVGPIEDAGYWRECQAIIRQMPKNVTVRHVGAIPPAAVNSMLRRYHLMVFPTRGENFSHAILEALLNGCPVLISDRTPWRGLQVACAGWDIPLEDRQGFVAALKQMISMDQVEFDSWTSGASAYSRRFCEDPDLIAASLRLFLAPIERSQDRRM